MIKKIAVKYTLFVVAAIALIMMVFIPIYFIAQNSIFINLEKKSMSSFYGEMIQSVDLSDKESAENFLEENNEKDYKISVFDSDTNLIFSNRRQRKQNTTENNQDDNNFIKQDMLPEYSENAVPVYSENEDNGNEVIALRIIAKQSGSRYYILIRERLRNSEAFFSYSNSALVITMVLYLIVCGAILVFLMRSLTKSIRNLNGAVTSFAEKDYSVRYKGKISKDEIGALAENFNTMADTIQDNINSISNYNFILQENIVQLKEYESIKTKFVQTTTHELKTPLAIISSQVEMMNCTEDADRREYYYNSAMEEISKMSALITNMLRFSADDAHAAQTQAEKINVSMKLEGLCDRISSVIQYKKLRFSRDILPDVYVNISGIHVEHIFGNYILNAINHARPSGLIKVRLCKTEIGHRLSVYNDGDNIPESELDEIWNKFYSMNKEDTDTGLGLFIVREIAYLNKDDCAAVNRRNGVEFRYDFLVSGK